MDKRFKDAYKSLNERQREAVDTIYGPVLVIAGPGTGKTQLISTRVGHILNTTDTLAQNILCLTFTEAGVDAMRQRLMKLLGKTAYDVQLSTYHAFGSELLRKYPEYLHQPEMLPIDELGADTIMREIVSKLPYKNPLKFSDTYIGDVLSLIGDAKLGLLSPQDIADTAKHNQKFLKRINSKARPILDNLTVVSKKSVPIFEKLLPLLQTEVKDQQNLPSDILPLSTYAAESLAQALKDSAAVGKTRPLTDWKNAWLAKDRDGRFIFDGEYNAKRLAALADIYAKYQAALNKQHLYDYDDMILKAIAALESNKDFKYTLAEQYQFIMLDEFQDTNPAQMRLIELLTDHPVNEGRPNILAVGDDDQAIYAFQGAEHANMARFAHLYKKVKVISLKDNYRSHADILEMAHGISGQITDRLHRHFRGVDKLLLASSQELPPKAEIELREFKSDAAQYAWLAAEIERLVKKAKLSPSEIAVLAPKHRYLLPLLPYLARTGLPVRYEKRENILDSPLVHQLEQMSRLVMAIAAGDETLADSLWPEVLSYDFWKLPTARIWEISWAARQNKQPWTKSLLEEPRTRKIAEFFLRVKDILPVTNLEQQLDALIGIPETSKSLGLKNLSPFFEFYFGNKAIKEPEAFTGFLSNLSGLRAKLREYKRGALRPFNLSDFTEFTEAYRAAGLRILDTSPYHESAEAINLLTAYGAKGREFDAVFIIAAQDEVWGSASRNAGNRLSLPANLKYIRYQGASEDERLRLFFVAATRTRSRLYLTSYQHTLAGRPATRLKYLDFGEDEQELSSRIVPAAYARVKQNDTEVVSAEDIEDYWSRRHEPPFKPSLKTLLAPKLERFQLSPTHVNQFTDTTNGGPEAFFLSSILGFPKALTPGESYGVTIHETIRWYGQQSAANAKPTLKQTLDYFQRQLKPKRLSDRDYKLLLTRGKEALSVWLKQRGNQFSPTDKYEHDFRGEGVFWQEAHLSGKVDRLVIDKKNKQISVIDFKTGQAREKWDKNDVRLHRYRQQLLFYKLLVEGSYNFRGYKVGKGVIEFVEPDDEGQIRRLELIYDDSELDELKQLISAVWRRIQALDWPDISKYPETVAGIRAFETDLKSAPAS